MRGFKKYFSVFLALALVMTSFVGIPAKKVSADTTDKTVVQSKTYDFTKLTSKTLAAGTTDFEGFSGSINAVAGSNTYINLSKDPTKYCLEFVVNATWSAEFVSTHGNKCKGLVVEGNGKRYGVADKEDLTLSDMPAGTYKITGLSVAETLYKSDGTQNAKETTANNGYLSTIKFTIKASTTPAALEGLKATANDGFVTLDWTASKDATHYKVSVSGSDGTVVGSSDNVEGTTFNTQTAGISLTNDTEYTFTVTPMNAAGAGTAATVNATPKAPTEKPGSFTLSVDAKNGKAVLNWTASDYAKTYDVYVNGAKNKSGLTGTDCTVEGLTNGTEYTFVVKAVNNNGETASNEVKATPEEQESNLEITECKGWLESAYVEWTNSIEVDGYNVYVKPVGGSYTKIDKELTRYYGTYYRADAVGLAKGNYQMKVAAVVGGEETDFVETEVLTVNAHIREGFAFDKNSAHYNADGVGAYKNDGTLKDGAQVIYIDDNNKDTVKFIVMVSGKSTECTGLGEILAAREKNNSETTPLAIRMIGKVTSPAGKNSNGYMQIKATTNITFEGVGSDATAYEWSFLLRDTNSIEVRNLAVMNFYDDGISLDTDNFNDWIHNCDIYYGQDRGGDQKKGDGSLDVKIGSDYCTFSYNHFWDSGKCSLCGMKDDNNKGYHMTYYGNWFDHADSRMPRVRGDQVHVYNNYYDGVSKYGAGACTGSSVFVENNVFRNTKYAVLISEQGSDVDAGGIFSGEEGGIIKIYNNKIIEGKQTHPIVTYQQNKTDFDAYEVSSRDEIVPDSVKTKKGGTSYSNFDTDSKMYAYNPLDTEDVVSMVTTYAGRIEGGDLQHKFNDETDDSNYDVITELRDEIEAYTSALVKAYTTGGQTYPPTEGSVPKVQTQVEFSVTDGDGNALSGMDLAVIDGSGKIVANWESDGNSHIVKRLPAGNYTLKMTGVPYGYRAAEGSSTFTVADKAELQKVSKKFEITPVKGKIAVKNLEFNRKAVAGVIFEIKDAKGNVVDTITTDSDGNAVSKELDIAVFNNGVYASDIVYTLEAVSVPEDYTVTVVSKSITIKYTGSAPAELVATAEVTAKSKTEAPLVEHSITVTADSNGKASASPEKAVKGDLVTLTAVPNDKYRFKEWKVTKGGITLSDSETAAFTMPDEDVAVQAVFEAIPGEKIILNPSDMTAGDITANKIQSGFVITANNGMSSGKPSGNVVVEESEKTLDNGVTVTKRINLKGSPKTNQRSIKITTAGASTITIYAMNTSAATSARKVCVKDKDAKNVVGSNSKELPAGGTEPVKAVFSVDAAGDYYIGSDSSTIYIYYIEVTNAIPAKESGAETSKYSIIIADDENGTVTASAAQAEEGATVTLTATPKSGYKFDRWNVTAGGAAVAVNNNSFTMPASNVIVQAVFTKTIPVTTEYSIAIAKSSNGTVTASASKAEAGVKVTLTATPQSGYKFTGWKVTTGAVEIKVGSDGSFTMPASDVTVEAFFEKEVEKPTDPTTWILGNVTRIPRHELPQTLDFSDFLPLFT